MKQDYWSKDSRNIIIAVALVIFIGLIVIWYYRPFEIINNNTTDEQVENGGASDNEDDNEISERQLEEDAVTETVLTLGERLKNVSLLSPNVNAEIRDNFRDLVTADLLSEWQARPELAPGRLIASSMPDRIEVRTIQRQTADRYRVTADVIEVPNNEPGDGNESQRSIALSLVKIEDRWVISSASLAPYDASDNWLRANQSNISFNYPPSLGTKYLSAQDWPPVMKVETDTGFDCVVSDENSISGESVRSAMINGNEYCVRTRTEGAAGSTYNNYDYATLLNNRLITASFSVRYPQCSNYGEAEATACLNERIEFDLDSLLDRIVRTVE